MPEVVTSNDATNFSFRLMAKARVSDELELVATLLLPRRRNAENLPVCRSLYS